MIIIMRFEGSQSLRGAVGKRLPAWGPTSVAGSKLVAGEDGAGEQTGAYLGSLYGKAVWMRPQFFGMVPLCAVGGGHLGIKGDQLVNFPCVSCPWS